MSTPALALSHAAPSRRALALLAALGAFLSLAASGIERS